MEGGNIMKEKLNTLYNEERKIRFIKEIEKNLTTSSSYLRTHFRNASSTEITLEKDLCDWSAYEIIEYYKLLTLTSFDSLSHINSVFTRYAEFCLKNGLVKDNQNHYEEITVDILMGCLNKAALDNKIIDRTTILKWIEHLPNPKDQFILLSLFEFGKSKDFQDITYAKANNVTGNKLRLLNRTVNISSKMLDIINDCENETMYYGISGSAKRKFPLIDNGYIVKSFPNHKEEPSDYQKGRNVYISCQRMFKYLGVSENMNPNAIVESGKIHMIKEMSKKLNITPEEFIYSKDIKEVEEQFDCIIKPSVFYKKYKDYIDCLV